MIYAEILELIISIPIRLGLFGYTKIRIPKENQNARNSWGANWFQINSNLFYNELVEMEEGSGTDYEIMSYGISMKPIKTCLFMYIQC